MGSMKTPGVYIVEKNAFSNSVVEAPTAIPAFIGITEKAENGSEDLIGKPWKISSMTEYIRYFGGAPKMVFTIDIKEYTKDDAVLKSEIFQYTVKLDNSYVLSIDWKKDDYNKAYTLYYNMFLFFANGGGDCYIVSQGHYDSTEELSESMVKTALEALEREQEVTLIVVPEAAKSSDCQKIQQLMLQHCGYTMQNRFALLDVQPKEKDTDTMKSQIETFQTNIGSNFLSYGAAYYPWLNSSVVGDKDLTGSMFEWNVLNVCRLCDKFSRVDPNFAKVIDAFVSEVTNIELKKDEECKVGDITFKFEDLNTGPIKITKNEQEIEIGKAEVTQLQDETGAVTAKKAKITLWSNLLDSEDQRNSFHAAMFNSSTLYQAAMRSLKRYLNLLPPSAAMAGLYTMVDNTRGVWKAPANITISYVDSPEQEIGDDQQADLNAPMNGKAINVIRAFRGEGIKVWGARTLDGNSLDWRYVNVRRTLLFLEESVKNAARAYVFEPNDANTWINMKCMIESFLRSVWKRGALAGATPEDAYSVRVGLGDTMTPEDILDGIMRITVLVAVSHPAEFIEITFEQQLQKS